MAAYDIHIKGGTIVDGTRVPRYRGDVWIKDGEVAQLGGRAPGFADRVVDADGLIVAPGFVDLHTHYDAQIRWDPYCTISGWHGVTSVVLGNCGFGFAPVQARLPRPLDAHHDAHRGDPVRIDGRGHACRLGLGDHSRVPRLARPRAEGRQLHPVHADRVADDVRDGPRRRQDPARHRGGAQGDARLLDEGMDAGLCGFSIQRLGRNSTQADFDGSPMVTDTMCDEDILNLARGARARDEGFIQITQATGKIKRDLAVRGAARRGVRRPVIHNAIAPTRENPRSHRDSR